MPKEMLPILDKPTIQYIVEEAARAGIEDIIIVTGKHKRAIEDHFDNQKELEMVLEEKGKTDLLEKSTLFYRFSEYLLCTPERTKRIRTCHLYCTSIHW